MSYEISYTTASESGTVQRALQEINDYSILLSQYNVQFKKIDFHLQVRDIKQVQGWILHISVVKSQINDLLSIIIPVLIASEAPFKVVCDKETARNMLDGNLGIERVGKIISIYPESIEKTLTLAKHLIALTTGFKGPAIPTDIHLGGNVYTRYGSFSPMVYLDSSGKQNRYIYNAEGQIIPDTYSIPFSLPDGINWPFDELVSYKVDLPKKIFHERYKPIAVLKFDPKGNVIKSLYLKSLFRVKWCVIKEGKKNMWSDDTGRDMPDRLLWQRDLHTHFEGIIPIPAVIDFFSEKGNTYLIMEYVKGDPLIAFIHNLNYNCKSWHEVSSKDQLLILGFILQIIDIIDKLHTNGFVHRDITPVNFLVDKKQKLIIIDNELAYSIHDRRPVPPFEAGTYGFMSPEQINVKVPTIKEDIYGLGASMIALLTGLSPLVFDIHDQAKLKENLYFFVGDKNIADIVATTLLIQPSERPKLYEIRENTKMFQKRIAQRKGKTSFTARTGNIDIQRIRNIIQLAIRGLVLPPTIIKDDLWYSKASESKSGMDKEQTGFAKNTGLSEGISGVLYFLGRAKMMGFDITPCRTAYDKALLYVESSFSKTFPNIAPGIYGGAAGIAMALVTGFNAGIIQPDQRKRQLIRQCFELSPISLDLPNGLSGQALALFQSQRFIEASTFKELITGYVKILISEQKKDGLWLDTPNDNRQTSLGFPNNNAGIIWFLLHYISFSNDRSIRKKLIKALNAMKESTKFISRTVKRMGYRKLLLENATVLKNLQDIVLMYLKAYDTLKDHSYKNIAEETLGEYPDTIIHDNFSQEVGLAGLGELYLSSYISFNNPKWLMRANWISSLFLHTVNKGKDDNCYWLSNNSRYPTADLMVGNSGIIHFLMRILTPERLGHRILY